VRLDRAIIADHEVVAFVVAHLVARDGAGKHEDAPVGDVTDHAALSEDELACGEDDSVLIGRGPLVECGRSFVVGGMGNWLGR